MTVKNGWKVLFEGIAPVLFPHSVGLCIDDFTGVYSEGGPPTDIADRLSASFPHYMSIGLGQRSTKAIAELDKYIPYRARNLYDLLRAEQRPLGWTQ